MILVVGFYVHKLLFWIWDISLQPEFDFSSQSEFNHTQELRAHTTILISFQCVHDFFNLYIKLYFDWLNSKINNEIFEIKQTKSHQTNYKTVRAVFRYYIFDLYQLCAFLTLWCSILIMG